MDPYNDLIMALSALQRSVGGRPEGRVATAALVRSLFHREFVRVRRELLRLDLKADVYEDTCYVRLTIEGRSIVVNRMSSQSRVVIEINGVTGLPNQGRWETELPELPDEVCILQVQRAAALFLDLVRQDIARRERQ